MRTNKPVRAFVVLAILSGMVLPIFAAKDGDVFRGTVTFQRSGDLYFFMEMDAGDVWRVQRARNVPPVKRGDVVDVRGKKIGGIATPRIKADSVAVVGENGERLTPPEEVVLGDLLVDPLANTNVVNRFGRVVTVEGTVRDINRRQTYMQVLMGEGDGVVQAVVPLPLASSTPKDLNLGARVRITGVYVYTTIQDAQSRAWTQIENPCVLAARIGDFVIISAAPFWTPLRLWILIGGILLFGGVLVFWVKSRERAKAVAVQRERLRLSRDLHDGFQQLLAGTMFRLEAAMNLMPEEATKAREQLEKASDALYHAQTGLRAALWSMTEESEGPNNLSGLVKYAAGRLAHWQGVVHFEFRGEERHVPPSLSGEILMGLQEAVGNALRHGGATDVKVTFSFRRDGLVIRVRDNGCGFDPAAVEAGGGHLGLRSMRERAVRLGGTMRLASEIGVGTLVVVRLPYGEKT